MLQTGRKTTRSVKMNNSNFINVIGDIFALWVLDGEKVTISFCKKLFSCVNYLQLLK